MSTSTPVDECGGGKKWRSRLYTMGACLLVAAPVVVLFASAVDRVKDAAERAH
jgi:hypothetical protein